jgi:DNA-binding NarL/FixJ family response regulator
VIKTAGQAGSAQEIDMPVPPIRVLIADSFPTVRRGLVSIYTELPDVAVVAETSTGHETIQQASRLQPDVVVVDLELPDMDGIHAVREIARRLTVGKVVAIGHIEDQREMLEVLDVGAAGYLVSRDPIEDFISAVRLIHSKGFFLSPSRVGTIANQNGSDPLESWRKLVSPQEYELLRCFAQCMTLQEAADHLRVAPTTVSTYRQRLLNKLKLPNTAHLIKFAIEQGIDT